MGKGMTAGRKSKHKEVEKFVWYPRYYAYIAIMIASIVAMICLLGGCSNHQTQLTVTEQQQVVQQVEEVKSSEEAETEEKVDYGVVENAMNIMNEPNEKSKLTDEDVEKIFSITYKQIEADSEAEQYETDLQNAKNVLREYSYEFPDNFEEVYQNWRTNYINAGEPVK